MTNVDVECEEVGCGGEEYLWQVQEFLEDIVDDVDSAGDSIDDVDCDEQQESDDVLQRGGCCNK